MSVFTAYLHKEWRSQRGPLLAYLALAWLALGLLLTVFVLRDGRDAAARTGTHFWLLATGLGGVLVLAAPQCVRGELGTRDDQFLRRLPGALAKAFLAKVLFLVLATAGIAVLACGLAWLVQGVMGVVQPQLLPPEFHLLPWQVAAPVLLIPWVLAVAWWLPRGRMALGATVVLGLLLGTAVWLLLRTAPGLERELDVAPLLWLSTPLALLVGFVSCVRGRRGGGALRSAKCGALALGLCLLPHGVWFGSKLVGWHWPDVSRPISVVAVAASPDGAFALAQVQTAPNRPEVPVRIDLATGEAVPLTGTGGSIVFDHVWHEDITWQDLFGIETIDQRLSVLSLRSGERWPLARDAAHRLVYPASLQARHQQQRLATTRLRQPNDCAAWLADDRLWFAEPDGTTTSLPFHASGPPQLAGHGFFALRNGKGIGFDLARRKELTHPLPHSIMGAFAVDGRWLVHARAQEGAAFWPPYQWCWFDPDTGHTTRCANLEGNDRPVAILSRDEVLFTRQRCLLLVYCVTDETVQELALPELVRSSPRMMLSGSPGRVDCGTRDVLGRLWLHVLDGPMPHDVLITVDPRSHAVDLQFDGSLGLGILAFPDERTLIAEEDHARIVRIDLVTKARTVLYGRRDAEEARR